MTKMMRFISESEKKINPFNWTRLRFLSSTGNLMIFISDRVQNTVEKGKNVHISIFSFSHSFHKVFLQRLFFLNSGLYGNGVNHLTNNKF